MISRIEDLKIYDDEELINEREILSTENISLYDIMGEDCSVMITKDKHSRFNIIIEDENDELIAQENIHPYAAESLAYFCRQFLRHYENTGE